MWLNGVHVCCNQAGVRFDKDLHGRAPLAGGPMPFQPVEHFQATQHTGSGTLWVSHEGYMVFGLQQQRQQLLNQQHDAWQQQQMILQQQQLMLQQQQLMLQQQVGRTRPSFMLHVS